MRTGSLFNEEAERSTSGCEPGGRGGVTNEQDDAVFGGVKDTIASKLLNLRKGRALV